MLDEHVYVILIVFQVAFLCGNLIEKFGLLDDVQDVLLCALDAKVEVSEEPSLVEPFADLLVPAASATESMPII